MKNLSSILSVSLIAVFLTSCFNKNNWNNNGNPLARNDVYMRGVKDMPVSNTFTDEAALRISRVEPAGDSVRLYTHIIDGDGMFTSGAARGNFRTNWCELDVNGNPVTNYTIREVNETQNIPTVYALVLDHSGSMSGKVQKMQEAVREFIKNKNPQDAICIVKYDSRTKLEVPVNTNVAALQAQFQANGLSGFGGTTAIVNGIMTGMETIRPTAYRRKVVISFTDGADNSSTVTKEYATWYAQQNNINLCTIDFNNSNYNNFMQELANNTGGTYTYFTNTNQFGDVFNDVVNKMNHSYIITYKKQTAGFQTVRLKYCGELQALEANADFTPERSNVQPVRDAQPPAVSASASSADQPVYYRPVSYYNNNTNPYKGGSGSGSGNIKGNGSTPPRTPGNSNGGSGVNAGDLKGQPGQIRTPSNGNTGVITKPDTSPVDNSGTVRPGNSNGAGTNTKPGTSPAGETGNTINAGEMNGKPGQIRTPSNGNTGGVTKPDTSPVNNNGNTTKPGNLNGIGTPTKEDLYPAGNNGNNNNGSNVTKPGTSPVNNNGNTTKPGNLNGIGTPTKEDLYPAGNNGNNNNNNGSNVTKPGTSPVNNNSNTTKPGNLNGIGTPTKEDLYPAGNNGSNNNNNNSGGNVTKPGTSPVNTSKPATTKPSTTKPTSNTGVGNSTKPVTTKPIGNSGSSGTTTKPGSGATGTKDVGGARGSRGTTP